MKRIGFHANIALRETDDAFLFTNRLLVLKRVAKRQKRFFYQEPLAFFYCKAILEVLRYADESYLRSTPLECLNAVAKQTNAVLGRFTRSHFNPSDFTKDDEVDEILARLSSGVRFVTRKAVAHPTIDTSLKHPAWAYLGVS